MRLREADQNDKTREKRGTRGARGNEQSGVHRGEPHRYNGSLIRSLRPPYGAVRVLPSLIEQTRSRARLRVKKRNEAKVPMERCAPRVAV